MATIHTNQGQTGVSGAAPASQTRQLQADLSAALANVRANVVLNYATGAAVPAGYQPPDVASLIAGGVVWVDYGEWPFGEYGGTGESGFGAFLTDAGIVLGRAAGFSTGAALTSGIGSKIGSIVAPSIGTYQHFGDPFDFDLHDWTWGIQVIPPGGSYPFDYGLPTTTGPSNPKIVAMPGAPIGRASPTNPNQNVYVYSAFALRIGRGFYFEAQQDIAPAAYAAFVARTVAGAGTARSVRSVVVSANTSTGSHVHAAACRAPQVTVHYGAGMTGSPSGWVAALQNGLRQAGYGSLLGPTGVDGRFGPDTLRALQAWERAHLGQDFGCGKIILDTWAGPAVWAALGVTGAGAVPGAPSQRTVAPTTPTPPPTTPTTRSTRKAATTHKAATKPQTGVSSSFLAPIVDPIAKAIGVSPQTVEVGGALVVGGALLIGLTQGKK